MALMNGKADESYAGSLTLRVKNAIQTMQKHYPGRYTAMLAGRSKESGGHGSIYPATVDEIESDLLKKSWASYEHSAVKAPCVCALARLPGLLGIIDIKDLPASTMFTLVDHKKDGYCELLYEGFTPRRNVNFTTMILGPSEEDPDLEVIYTFHPGDPIVPSELHGVLKNELRRGDSISLKMALEKGFTYAKMV
jgi:hypothetical protein